MAETETTVSSPRQPLLDLTTLVTRHSVRINGANYELKSPSEFPLYDQLQLEDRYNEMRNAMVALRALPRDSDRADVDAAQASADLPAREICRLGLLAPAKILAHLRTEQCAEIARAFFLSPRLRAAMTAPAPTEATAVPPTGPSSSVVSPASTGARRGTGARKSRSR